MKSRVFALFGVLVFLLPTLWGNPVSASVQLSAIAPSGGASVGVPIQVTGLGFDPTASNNIVTFTLSPGTLVSSLATGVLTLNASTGLRRLSLVVPSGLPVGTISVTVQNKVTHETSTALSWQIISISLLSTVSASAGATNMNVSIKGSANTQFVAGNTRAVFGAGITVNSTTVVTPTSLTANISISATAALGSRIVSVITSQQTATLSNGFSVVSAISPPTLQLLTPLNAILTNQPTQLISGTVSDTSLTSVTLQINGVGQPVPASSGQFSVSVTLPEGISTLVAVAQNGGGEGRSSSRTLTVDTTPPIVTITSPGDQNTVNLSGMIITGAVDELSVDHVILIVNVTELSVPVANKSFSGTITLAQGANTLAARGIDAAGNIGKSSTLTIYLNRAPHFTSIPPISARIDQLYSYSVKGEDGDGDTLTFSLTKFPAGMSINQNTGLVTWTPSGNQLGSQSVSILVSDSKGGSGTQSFDIGVVDLTPPSVTLFAPGEVLPGSKVTVTAQAVDNVAVAAVIFEVTGADSLTVTSPPYQRVITLPSVASVGTTVRVKATARDTGGNSGSAETTLTIVSVPDTDNPVITLNLPPQVVPGRSLHFSANAGDNVGVAAVSFFVGGFMIETVTTTPYESTYLIPSGTPVGSSLVFSAQAEDYSGNKASASGTVLVSATPDTTSPTVKLSLPPQVIVGDSLLLSATATDDVGVVSVSFIVDHVLVKTVTAAPYQALFTMPPGTPIGTVFHVDVRGMDFSGLEGTNSGEVLVVTPPAAGRGVITGKVYDDTKGLPLEGVTIQLISLDGQTPVMQAPNAISDALGRYRIVSAIGLARIRLSKLGFTTVDRLVQVVDGKRIDPFDARLTPLDTKETIISSVTGGTASNLASELSLAIPSGAIPENRTFRITRVGAQGLVARLPLGWSPVVVIDLSPPEVSFGFPASISVPVPSGLQTGSKPLVVRWDEISGDWIALEDSSSSSDGKMLTASVSRTGQYAFLLADRPPTNPPPAIVGQSLPGLLANPPPDNVTASITPSPKILFAQSDAHSHVTVQATPPSQMPSGTPFRLDLTEAYHFLDGTHLYPDPFAQDILLYAFPPSGSPLNLLSDFMVTPSRSAAPFALQLGVIDLAASLTSDPHLPRGSVIDSGGGTIVAMTGERLVIPPGAATEVLPVLLSPLTRDQFPAALPAGFTFLGAATVDLHGGTLNLPATLSISAPSGLSATAQVLVVQLVEVNGVSYLALVGLGAVQGNDLVVMADPKGDGSLLFPGIRSEGRYVFLRADQPIGFVSGTVLGNNGLPLNKALVSLNGFSIIALANADGKYTLASPVGNVQITATDPKTNDMSTQSGTVNTQGSVLTQGLSLSPTPPSVVSVAPADGAQNIPLVNVITVSFSEPVDPASVELTSVLLFDGSASVPGTISLSPDKRTLTFRSNVLLVSRTSYRLTVAATIKDLTGNAMGTPFVSHFTTVDLSPPLPPPAGSISATIPDQTGTTTISGSQGSVEPGGAVVVNNITRGTLTTLTPNADGSFTGKVDASTADRLELNIRDAAGNQTTVPVGPFSNPDGSVVVGQLGGHVDGPGGVVLDIPPGALPNGTVVKVDPVVESDLALPPPPGFPFIGGVRMSLGGVKPLVPLHIAVPAPAGATTQDQVLVVRAIQLPKREAWTLVDRAHLIGGKYQTASPPFPGVVEGDTYAFVTSNGSCLSYVTIKYKFGSDVIFDPFLGIPLVYPSVQGEETHTIAATCNSQFNIQVLNPNTEQVIQQISQQAPAAQDDIFTAPGVVTDDATVPGVVWTNALSSEPLNRVEVLFSEPMDPVSVRDHFKIKDSNQFSVGGTVELQQGNTRAVFSPTIPFHLGEQYVMDLSGAADLAGNPIAFNPVIFKIFTPHSLSALLQELGKCSGSFCVPAGATGVAYIGKTLFVANGLKTLDEQYSDPANPKRLLAFNVSDPYNPILIGSHPTGTNPRALAVVPNASFILPDGSLFVGDIVAVAGGGRVPGGELNGKLEIYDVTACTKQLAVANCLEGALKGHKLLSTATGIPPQSGVPPAAGVPLQVATFASRDASGIAISAAAYVVVSSVGLEAVDIAKAFNFPITPTTNLGPDGLVLGDFLDVAVLKTRVLTIGVPGGFAGSDGYRLQVYSLQLSLIDEINQAKGLPGSLARVAAGENFVFDIDGDGNLGQAEEQDGDPVKAKDELFDFAIVGSGPLTEDCPTSQVPCGILYIIDLSAETDLGHPGIPQVISRIFLPGSAFSIQADPQAKLAYVEVRGQGLAIVDLSSLLGVLQGNPQISGLLDQNGDGRDDRILNITPVGDIIITQIQVDPDRGIGYVNGASTGVMLICVNKISCSAVQARDIKLRTEVDRINGDVCLSAAALEFDLFHAANVTIKVDDMVITYNNVLQENIAWPAGKNFIPVTADMVPLPGEHNFEITAVIQGQSQQIIDTARGKIMHEVLINASLPIGHTMIKGVDIWDGHLTHSAQDAAIPGRGLSLDFTRTYSSAGNSSDGPLGAGWTHSYMIRLIHNNCGRYVVIGGEGSGNAFTFDGTVFRPKIGYHSTLIRDSQNTGNFDFFTKAHIQYHFEKELTMPDEVYTLRFIKEPNGNQITLDYLSGDGDPTTLDSVTDSSGRSLLFEYQQISQALEGPKNRIVRVKGRNNASGSNLLGLEVTYEYDSFGNLTRVTRKSPNPGENLNDERVEIYTYNILDPLDRHNLFSYTDPNHNTTSYDYFTANDDVPGFIASFGVQKHEIITAVRQPEAVTSSFSYNFGNNTRVVTDPRGPDEPIPPTTYALDNYGATVRIEEPLGKITTMEWCTNGPSPACPDQNGNPGLDVLMIKKIDAEGRTHLYEYGDRLGNPTKETVQFTGNKAPVTLKDGTTNVNEISTTSTYEPTFSKMTSKTDAEGNTTVLLIDAEYPGKSNFCPDTTNGSTGNLLGVRDAEGNVTCYAYASNGDLLSVTDPKGFVTHYTQYDAFGNREKTQDPLGNITNSNFDERSRLIEIRDTFTHHVRYAYDGLNRKIREERLDDLGQQGTPQITTSLYFSNGEPKMTTNGLGQAIRYFYDGLNRNIEKREEGVVQADGSNVTLSSRYVYDKGNNVTQETDPRGITKIHTYDALNRRTQTQVQGPFTPNEVLMTTTYDRVGNTLSMIDPNGHLTTLVYDGLYRMVQTNLPFPNAVINTAYDRLGHKVLETDAKGHQTSYLYDNIYRLTQKSDAIGNKGTFGYDQAGNKILEKNLSSGLVVEYLDYDGLNRPKRIKQTVPLGEPGLTTAVYETRYEYQDSVNAVAFTDFRGFRTRSVKDALDRVAQTVVDLDGLKLTTAYTFDGNGNLKTIKDAQGGDIDVIHEYDGLNRKIRSTYVGTPNDAGQPVTEEFVYDGDSNVVRYKDKRGVVFITTYDNLNRLLTKKVKETITNGGSDLKLTAYTYDDASTKVTQTDPNGNVTVTYSDGLHRTRIVDDPGPNAPYDSTGLGPFPIGLVVYEYDGVNKRAQIDKKGQRTEYDYDAINRLVDTREFDLSGSLQTTTHVQYLDQQNRKRVTDRRGIISTSQFDALQRLVLFKRSGRDMATYYGSDEVLLETHEYDGNGNKTAFSDGQGNRTEFTYDGADRQITVIEGAGSPVATTTTTTYDNVGNVLTVKDGRNHGGAFDARYTFDARYRKVNATNGELETVTYAYDANNNLTQMMAPKGAAFTTTYRYDEFNKLLAVDETPRADSTTAAGVTRFFYDGNRNKIAQQDANGNLVTYRYDALNRLTDTFQHTIVGTLTDATTRGADPTAAPTGGDEATAFHWQIAYDLNGNQTITLDAKNQRVEKSYDYLNRLQTKLYTQHAEPGLDFQMQSITYAYDGNGNVISINEVKKLSGAEVTETTLQTYDPLDRLGTRLHRDYDDPAGKLIAYTYNIQGNRTKVIDPDNIITTYTYDARNRLSTAITGSGTTTYTYWENSLIKTIEYPNGSVTDHSDRNAYDRANRELLIKNRPLDGSQPPFSIYAYTYDGNSNRLTQVETQKDLNGGNPETTSYAYDNLDRLLSVTYGPETQPAGKVSYTYEPNGNRLSEQGTDPHTGQPIKRTFKYEQLPEKSGVTFNHVNALTQIVDNLDSTQTVNYEYDQNLNQVAKEKGGGRTDFYFGIRDEMLATGAIPTPTRFDYDFNGMRIKKNFDGFGGGIRYLYDDRSVLVEYGGLSTSLATFHKYDYGYGLLSLTEVDQTGQNRDSQFYLTDGLMSTSNLTDKAGGLLQSYRYDAWGRVRDQFGTSDNPRQYAGHYTDSETGLHYFGARYYDDETGRFLSQDPYLGEGNTPPSLHRYLYAYANPLRFVDFTGYESEDVRPGEPGGPDVQAGSCMGNLCLRRSDNTWVERGEHIEPEMKSSPIPCSDAPSSVGGCLPSKIYEADRWLNEENEKLEEKAKKAGDEAAHAFEFRLAMAQRYFNYQKKVDYLLEDYHYQDESLRQQLNGWLAESTESIGERTTGGVNAFFKSAGVSNAFTQDLAAGLGTIPATAVQFTGGILMGPPNALVSTAEAYEEGGMLNAVNQFNPFFHMLVAGSEARTLWNEGKHGLAVAKGFETLSHAASTVVLAFAPIDAPEIQLGSGAKPIWVKPPAWEVGQQLLAEKPWNISGHGFVVPVSSDLAEGASVTVFAKPGEIISDELGRMIERGTIPPRVYQQTLRGRMPFDVLVQEGKGLGIARTPKTISPGPGGSFLLSERVGPGMHCNLAACLSDLGMAGEVQIMRDVGGVKLVIPKNLVIPK